MWKSLVGDDEEQGESLLGEDSGGLCSLSPTQRIYGFAACLIAGLACMLLSMIVFAKPIKFALLFTFGNVLAVGSTAFLLGPAQQLGMMLDNARVFATAIYIGCVVIALICALWIHDKLLTIIAIIIEIGALIWYSLSYIPFARRMVSELMIRLCDTEL
ncbi:hypothetical protein HN51_041734 [Arachis hypogaea]|uniref:Vesicle transport protein n=2 Tax=Arachis hypogaea TaxID=3818 RepID=A0A444YTV8_ARAHY|nr:vesicle transport protein SFT2B [Arachis ipaensis]XP_016162557.1 vesicle transport protein SFT2B [Arachis ipaensis]XP_020960695.1 vesicle transport protein SFT2B [Arachis ipaensis]XP_020960696.1 vesicle transport protein SFT2B [Arachis ipaensis]XP_025659150.1 vesicle transport protein SFT2B [Arachis hypogaea]XP_025659151.1 vesicle transport protein SFT2B [Arachis hypogaea]QHN87562.1 Vesicle transport proteinB [Arachis hypogaea]RYR05355.1 hypothetical protein Ahy_B06g085228 isoform A [Arac